MRTLRLSVLATAAALVTALVAATPAPGAVTIGSDLTKPSDFGRSIGFPSFTVINRSLPGRQTIAPFDGVIVRWRIKPAGTNWGTVRLRVMRELAADPTYAAIHSSDPQTPGTVDGPLEFPTSLRIEAGDYIGLEATDQISGAVQPGAIAHYLGPSPADGGAPAPVLFEFAEEVFFNADIEPDHLDLKLRGRKKQPLNRLKVKASCLESACTVRLKGKVVVKGTGKRFKLKRRKRNVEAEATRRIGLRVKGGKKQRRLRELVKDGKKVKVKVKGKARAAGGRTARAKKKIRLKP